MRLLLRAHAEASWLAGRVLPVVHELERARPREGHSGTTLAYLEVLWVEACGRAAETDGARIELEREGENGDALYERARRYHAAVRRSRAGATARVKAVLERRAAARRH